MIARATGRDFKIEPEAALTGEGMIQLAKRADSLAAQLWGIIDADDEEMHFSRLGVEVRHQRSTIIAQIAHHSSEHRTQISDILAMNGLNIVNLDTIDLWSYESFSKTPK
jgi:hypothetical protein